MKFTKEEINLCKQVKKKHIKDIYFGDWYFSEMQDACVCAVPEDYDDLVFSAKEQSLRELHNIDKAIPLWTISDCLEFFEERAIYLEGLCQVDECEFECDISEMDDMGLVRHTKRHFEGKTPLEACLKAVLAVLEERK